MLNCVQRGADSICLHVRLIPNAAMDRIDGEDMLADGSHVLKVRVRAVPEKGRANKALIKYLAKKLHLAPSRLQLVKGATARKKTLQIQGEPAALIQKMQLLCQ